MRSPKGVVPGRQGRYFVYLKSESFSIKKLNKGLTNCAIKIPFSANFIRFSSFCKSKQSSLSITINVQLDNL